MKVIQTMNMYNAGEVVWGLAHIFENKLFLTSWMTDDAVSSILMSQILSLSKA